MTVKALILSTIKDSVSGIMYYDRKEDEELPVGAIEKAIKDGTITKREILEVFAKEMFGECNMTDTAMYIRIQVDKFRDSKDGEFPLDITVRIYDGKIVSSNNIGEPPGLYDKVSDRGIYTLLDMDFNEVNKIEGYVPNGIVPGEYGDYIDLEINEEGYITNWPKQCNLSEFDEEEN